MAWPDVTTVIDNFNRASLGANWTTGSWYGDSALSIISSTLLGCASDWGGGYYSATSYGPDVDLIVDVSTITSGQPIGLFGRLDASNTPSGYKFMAYGAGSYIARVDAGSDTQLGLTFTCTPVAGDKLGLEIIGGTGNNITAHLYHSAAWSAPATRSDGTYTGAGYFGLEIGKLDDRLDNLSGGTISSGIAITAALSGTGTLTAAQPTAHTAITASPSGTGNLSATFGLNTTVAANLSGAGDLAASLTPAIPIIASLSGTGTLTVAEPSTAIVITASLTGTGSLTVAEPALDVAIAANLTGAGDLSATLDLTTTLAAVLTGAGDLVATLGAVDTTIAASLTGVGDLSATLGVADTAIQASLTGLGDLSATLTASTTIAANLSGTGDLSATFTATTSIAANLGGSGDLSATVEVSAANAIAASLTGSGDLAATLGVVDTAISANLSGTGDLSATVAVPTTVVPVVRVGAMPSPWRYMRDLPTDMLPVEVAIRLVVRAAMPTIILQPGAVTWDAAIAGDLRAHDTPLSGGFGLPWAWEVRVGRAIGPALADVGKHTETRDRRAEVLLRHQRDLAERALADAEARHEEELLVALVGAFEVQDAA